MEHSGEARSAAGAAAVQAALNGASVTEAYQQQNIALPSVGAQVTAPVAPEALQAGDVGMWKNRLVMALGSGKALVAGQLQTVDEASSGPDFLGWFDPTKLGGSSVTAAPHSNIRRPGIVGGQDD